MESLKYNHNIDIINRMKYQRNIEKLRASAYSLKVINLGILFKNRNRLYSMMNAIVYDLWHLFDIFDDIPYENKIVDLGRFISNAIIVLDDINHCVEYKPNIGDHAIAIEAYAEMINFARMYMCQDCMYTPNIIKMCNRIFL